MRCSICSFSDPPMFLSLGAQPPSDAFLKKEELERPEKRFPLDLHFCPRCSLVQLGYAVDPDLLFRDYVYATGYNEALKKSFEELVQDAVRRYELQKGALAVDIGSNDGTLLKNFLPHGLRILGVDPSSVAAEAKKQGVPTIVDYFNEDIAKKIAAKEGGASIITATNVFAHVQDLDSVMRGVEQLLLERGVFISESGYILDILETLEYDCVYHEHLRYYSLHSLQYLFDRFGMEIIRVERTRGSSGGSIRVAAARKGAYREDPSVSELLLLEKDRKLLDLATYTQFASRVEDSRKELVAILAKLRKEKKKIVGIGAPAKGNTLLNYCEIGTETVEYLAETNVLKIGLYSPGMRIPVKDEKEFFASPPEAALLLAWNYASVLLPKFRAKGFRGAFVIPNPRPHLE